MILAIDAGNTLVKWGLHDGRNWQSIGSVAHLELVSVAKIWRSFEPPESIVISNVAGEKIRSELSVLVSHLHREPHWIVAKDEECSVINGYRHPAQLGSDRWASLIAARAMYGGSCLVVSVGTAMTVDALSGEGKFLGGIIVPGPQLMVDALTGRTAGIRLRTGAKFQQLPDNTADAVYSGSRQALAGAIEQIRGIMMEMQLEEPLCILSGGGAAEIEPLLRMPYRVVENLVLEGLIRIAKQ